MKKNYYVIGCPVDHSLSPAIHNALYKKYNIKNCEYSKCEITPDSLKKFLESISDKKIYGFNITMPLKEEILPYLDYTDASVRNGANTVSIVDGKLHGFSTDAAGFYKSLASIKSDYSGNIVFIGSGAVAQTLVLDAKQKNPKRITVLNRTVENARQLEDKKIVFADSLNNIKKYMPNCDLLINTTPLGMNGVNQDFENLDFINLLPRHACVSDLIYAPLQTTFLEKAAQSGHKTLNGLPMLIWQAFYAFEKFFYIMPNDDDYKYIYNMLIANN